MIPDIYLRLFYIILHIYALSLLYVTYVIMNADIAFEYVGCIF